MTLTEIAYRLKIFLYAGYEYIETTSALLQKLYPEKVLADDGRKLVNEGSKRFDTAIKSIYDSNFSYRLCYNLRNHLQHNGIDGINFHRNATGNYIILSSHSFAQGDRYIQQRFSDELLAKPDKSIDVIEQLYKYKENMDDLYYSLFTSCSNVFMDRQTVIRIFLELLRKKHDLSIDNTYCIFETQHSSNQTENSVVIYKKSVDFLHAADSIAHFRKICGDGNYSRLMKQAKEMII